MIAKSSTIRLRLLKHIVVLSTGALLSSILVAPAAAAQAVKTESNTRKLKLSTPPEYTELARKMNIQGVARVLLTVAPDGRVVAVKELGGNPVLIASLVQAVRKWKYEPAARQSEIEVRFEFSPSH